MDDSHVIEELDICEGNYTSNVDASAPGNREMSSKSGNLEVDPHQSEPPVVLAKEIWRGKEADSHIFTTCPAEATFSLGCFPLFKLRP